MTPHQPRPGRSRRGVARLVVAATVVLALASCTDDGSTATGGAAPATEGTSPADEPVIESLDPLVSINLFVESDAELWDLGGRVVEDEGVRDELISRIDRTSTDPGPVRAVDLTTHFLHLAVTGACEVPPAGPWLDVRQNSITVREQPLEVDYDCEAEVEVFHVFALEQGHRHLLADAVTDFTPFAQVDLLVTEPGVDTEFLDRVTQPTFLISPADFATFHLAIDDPVLQNWLTGYQRSPLLLWPGASCDPAETSVRFWYHDDRTVVEVLDGDRRCDRAQRFLAPLRVTDEQYEMLSGLNPDWDNGLDEVVRLIEPGPSIGWHPGTGGPDPGALRTHRLMTAADVADSELAEFNHVEFPDFDEAIEFLVVVGIVSCRSVDPQDLVILDDRWLLVPGFEEAEGCDEPWVGLRAYVIDREHLPLFADLPIGN